MKRRPFVQRTTTRKQVLRRRRIYTSFADTWERLRLDARRPATNRGSSDADPEVRAA